MSFFSYNGYKLNSHLTCFQHWRHSSVGRASHWYRGGHGFKSHWSLRIFSGALFAVLLKLLHNCEDHFHLYSLSTVHSYDLYHIYILKNYVDLWVHLARELYCTCLVIIRLKGCKWLSGSKGVLSVVGPKALIKPVTVPSDKAFMKIIDPIKHFHTSVLKVIAH